MSWFVPSSGLSVLVLLLLESMGVSPGDALTLCYNFSIIPRPKPGQPWCEVQGQLEGFVFFQHQCGKQVNLVFPLATKENAMEAWKEQADSFKSRMEELKRKLLDLQPEMVRTSEPLSLQGTMVCEEVTNRHIRGSWQFVINGHIPLHLDGENGQWREDPADKGILEKWETDREMNNLLLKMANGDCKMWLQQVVLHQEKMLETTASPATAPGTVAAKARTVGRMSWLTPVMRLTCTVLPGILGLH